MALSIKTAAEAQSIVKSLRSDPNNLTLRIEVSHSLTDPNFGLLVIAGYIDFILSEADNLKGGQARNSPIWYISASEISASLQKSNEIAGDKGELDLSILFRLRDAILYKLLKPMLSTIPGAGLQTLAPGAHSGDLVISLLGTECVAVGTRVVYTVIDSLTLYPAPGFLGVFCKAGAVEVAAICWYYCSEPKLRNMCTVTLDYVIHMTMPSKIELELLTRQISAEMIADKCEEILREFLVPGRIDTWNRNRITQLLANMCDPSRSELAITLSSKGIPGVIVEIARYAMKEKDVDRVLVQKMGGLLGPNRIMFWFTPKAAPALLEIIEHGETLQLIAQVFLDTSFVDITMESLVTLLELIGHCASCSGTRCPYLCSDIDTDAIARVLKQEDLWLDTYIALQALVEKTPRGSSKVMRMKLGAWVGVGKAVGLVEPALSHQGATQDNRSSGIEGIPEQDKNGCWYGRCGRHGKINEETEWMLLRCSGCKRARYCSKECQSVDWKIGHKTECRSMKRL